MSGKSNESINRKIEIDPETLPQLTKMELFATIANGFHLLIIVEEASICTVVSLFCSRSKVAGWFQLVALYWIHVLTFRQNIGRQKKHF